MGGMVGGLVSKVAGSVMGTGDVQQANMIDQAELPAQAAAQYKAAQPLNQALNQQALTGGGPLDAIFKQQLGNANNQAASLAASQKGVNPGMAARVASNAVGQQNQQALGQAAQNQLSSQQLAAGNNAQQQNIQQGAIASQNSANASLAAANNKTNADATGSALGGLGSLAMSGMTGGMFAEGGMVPNYADGGAVQPQSMFSKYLAGALHPTPAPAAAGAPQQPSLGSQIGLSLRDLFMGKPEAPAAPVWGSKSDDYKNLPQESLPGSSSADYMNLPQNSPEQPQALAADMGAGTPLGQPMADNTAPGSMMAAHGGKVPAMVSPGEVYVPPSKVKSVAKGKDPRAVGETIPGKAAVKGDSLKNDTVAKDLAPGGVVIPKSIMESKDPAAGAHKFVSSILAKQGLKARRKK